jgi:glycosyltransferase involved in cell wall biosynthesis
MDELLFWPWKVAADTVMGRRLTRMLDEADVFHSSDVLLWRHPRALNVVTIYDLTALFFPEYHTADTRKMQQRKYRFAQDEADVVIAISESTKRDVVDNLEIPEDRVRVVHGGVGPQFRPIVDRETLTRALAPLGVVPGTYIVHVGTIEPRKNLVRLLEAYATVREMLPPPRPKLVLAGAAGWRVVEPFERIETLDLGSDVMYLGHVPAEVLPALYNGALLLAYPSLYEGFGLPPLEAMACGVPVVASNVSSIPEVVGDAGVLVEPRDTHALAEAIATLLDDSELRLSLGRAGVERAAHFSWERAATEVLDIYRMGR